MTYEKLKGVVSLASNNPGAPTGYGVQAEFLVRYMKRHGMNVGVLSNYGLRVLLVSIALSLVPCLFFRRVLHLIRRMC